MWLYAIQTGRLSQGSNYVGSGYSGHGAGLNNVLMQNVPNVGPIPAGAYTIGGPVDTDKHGPFFLPLTPNPANQMWGRDDFGMHGDEIENPGKELASHGCIVLPRGVRELIASSQDNQLTVI